MTPSSLMPHMDEAGRLLCRPGHVYRLRAGSAGLYADDAARAGSMRLLARIEDDTAIFGLPESAAGGRLRLILVPDAGADVDVRTTPLPAEELTALTDGWFHLALQVLRKVEAPDLPEAGHERLALSRHFEGGEHDLPAGEAAVPPGDEVLWCTPLSGALHSPWQHRAPDASALPFPVSREAPVEAAEDSRFLFSSSVQLASRGALESAFDAFNAAFAGHLAGWLTHTAETFSRRITQAADADATLLADAMRQLGDQRQELGARHDGLEPPLMAMMRVVAEAMGVELAKDLAPPLGAHDADEFIKVLAESAGLRARRVQLRTGWWRGSSEAMLAFLEDGTPVALIPQDRKWRLIRPDGTSQFISDTTPAPLHEQAYVLYRGFGDISSGPGKALIHFVAGRARRELVLIGFVSLAAGLLGLAMPFLSGFLIQTVIPEGVRSEVLQLILAVVAVSCGVIGFELVKGLTVLRAESLLGSSIEGALWNRMLRLPVGFFRQFGAGDLALRADAVNEMRRTLGFATLTALISALFSVVNLVVLFSYGLAPALLALAVCVIEIILLSGHAAFNMSIQRQALANAGTMQTLTVQIFQGISKLRVAAAESRLLARWTRLFARDQSLHYRANVVAAGMTAFGAGWNIIVMAALIGLVGLGFTKMTLGDYVTFSGVFGQFVAATLSLASIIPAIASVAPLWNRARPILTEPTEDSGERLHPGMLRGEIEAVRVSFAYPGGEPALNDVSLHVPAGTFVAIVGPSGSGKSTLLRLLIGFEAATGGHVLLDGRNLRDLDAGAVRRQLGIVLQHSRIEAGSIYQNIAGASPMTADEAWEAAEQAGLARDLEAMPMGLHTHVDDSGSTLSGGQRQRLLLARAIARHPRIMLLDEATSALDNVVQAHVMETLAQMNVTRIVVAHRLSTVRDADMIVVMDNGRVVETGTYEALAAAGGLFTELIRRQMA